MPGLFTRIIAGELPGRFVWRDAHCVAFLTIAPLRPGHTLVVPRKEIDDWLDLDPSLAMHLTGVAQKVGRAIKDAFPCRKVGVMVAGLEVPHVHIHLTPIDSLHEMDFGRQDKNAKPSDLDAAAQRIRDALTARGHAEASA